MKPIIGIPLRYEDDKKGVSISYVYESMRRSVQKLGGDVMPISPVVDTDSYKTRFSEFPELTEENIKSLNRFLDMCDGLILPGGIKLIPTDLYILEYAIKKQIPVLGICLSMHMMSCYQEEKVEMEKNDENGINHDQGVDEIYKHKVKIDKNSLLYHIIGEEEIEVNSFHKYHATPNSIYKTVAYSEDGLIEAIEFPSKVFNMGVQWHPERMIDYDEPSRKLMEYFINETEKVRLEKEKIVKLL